MKAKVLNGEVEVGDTVAYMVKTGSYQYTNIARVNEVIEKPHPWKRDLVVPALKVTVAQSSDYLSGPYNATVSVLRRVVKLNV